MQSSFKDTFFSNPINTFFSDKIFYTYFGKHGNKPSQVVVKERQVYQKIRQLQKRSSQRIAEIKAQFKHQFGKEIQLKEDSKVITGGMNIKDSVGQELNNIKIVSWGKNFEGIQNEITNTITAMKYYSNGTSSSCKGYFPVLGKYGICIAAYGIYFEKIHTQVEGKVSESESISYLFGTYEYVPVGGWTKATIGMLVEACPLNDDMKESIYNSLVEKLVQDNNQKKIMK